MHRQYPIGLFDSGIGGTTIWREINSLLPNENTIFLADQGNAPYGIKTKNEITKLSLKNTAYLVSLNCKVIVIACNTATTNSIHEVRATFPNIPIVGIEPAIKPAVETSKSAKIGILATKGTITSDFFSEKIKKYNNVQIYEQIGYDLVNLIESGKINSPQLKQLLTEYLTPMVNHGIDTLVLGCTHYPYLIPIIEQIIPQDIKVIDSGSAVARQTKRVLEQLDLLNTNKVKATCKFLTNTSPEVLQSFIPEYKAEQSDKF